MAGSHIDRKRSSKAAEGGASTRACRACNAYRACRACRALRWSAFSNERGVRRASARTLQKRKNADARPLRFFLPPPAFFFLPALAWCRSSFFSAATLLRRNAFSLARVAARCLMHACDGIEGGEGQR